MRVGKPNPLSLGLLVVAVAAAALFAGFRDFVAGLDSPPPPLPRRVDLIAALSGGSGRLEEGVRLLREGRAPLLLLVGFHSEALAARAEADPELAALVEAGRIVVEPRSGSTLEDAEWTRALALERGIRSVLLITSAYHLRRARLAFRVLLPDSIELYTWPVRSGAFRAGRWYADESSRRLVFGEFLKYLVYRVRLGVYPPPPHEPEERGAS